ncbi:DUF2165 domain-containing protein [Pseudonocardia sp. RS11V-5]|uniref:DUF2165 domain-containing protein n=1 Tax=Pseudonocardia terrae TaxID=2905831 RepID=UPI001E591CA9|nr:DUF2165 domain-containing protein [Pseudonocardia terrae]MCE3556489.1 DUF2165 domain-containing protein [Pseudonocardia terrae]
MTSSASRRHAPEVEPTGQGRSRWWRGAGTLSGANTFLVAANALYLLLVAFGNITDFSANQAFVQHVLAMDTTNFGAPSGTGLDPRVMWRAVTDPGLQTAAYVGVIVWELAAGLVLAAAVVVRLRGRHPAHGLWLSTAGLMMVLVLFLGGFIVMGGEWFQMWRSTAWNGLDPAFRNTMVAMVTLVLLHLDNRVRACSA